MNTFSKIGYSSILASSSTIVIRPYNLFNSRNIIFYCPLFNIKTKFYKDIKLFENSIIVNKLIINNSFRNKLE